MCVVFPEYSAPIAARVPQGAGDALDSYGILSLPTFLFFRGGKMTDRFIGLLTRDMFEEKIEENLRRV